MADEIAFTPRPVRVTTATIQYLDQAIDVSAYDEPDLQLGVVGLEGTSPDISLRIITSMSKDSEDGWSPVAAFSTLNAVGAVDLANFKGLLRYVRWEVTSVGGSGGPAVTFVLGGMARKWA